MEGSAAGYTVQTPVGAAFSSVHVLHVVGWRRSIMEIGPPELWIDKHLSLAVVEGTGVRLGLEPNFTLAGNEVYARDAGIAPLSSVDASRGR